MDLPDLYYSIESHPVSALSSAKKLSQAAGVEAKIVKEFLAGQHAYTKHRPAVRHAVRRSRMLSSGLGRDYQADLVDMQKHSRINRGMRFILTVIDIFSKKAFARALKRKMGANVRDALQSIWEEGGPSQPTQSNARITMATDMGKEFLNAPVQKWFSERGIHHFTLQGDHKAAVVERFQRTLKERLHRLMTARKSYKYLDLLPVIIKAYNGTPHGTTGVRPDDVSLANELQLLLRQYEGVKRKQIRRITSDNLLRVGDSVKISKSAHPFGKGFLGYCQDAVFTVDRVISGVPNKSYVLRDAGGEKIQGAFYREQVQKVAAAAK